MAERRAPVDWRSEAERMREILGGTLGEGESCKSLDCATPQLDCEEKGCDFLVVPRTAANSPSGRLAWTDLPVTCGRPPCPVCSSPGEDFGNAAALRACHLRRLQIAWSADSAAAGPWRQRQLALAIDSAVDPSTINPGIWQHLPSRNSD